MRQIELGDYEPLLAAYDEGKLHEREWDDIMRIDGAALVRSRHEPGAPEHLLMLEISIVVDVDDVSRAKRRADLVRKLGIDARAAVDGDVILPDARELARNEDVEVLVSSMLWD